MRQFGVIVNKEVQCSVFAENQLKMKTYVTMDISNMPSSTLLKYDTIGMAVVVKYVIFVLVLTNSGFSEISARICWTTRIISFM